MAEIRELIELSPHGLLLAILLFGVAPGFLLRLIVKLYPVDDPRRQELTAELYSIKRRERPFFVAEQLETALFDGLFPRVSSAQARRRSAIEYLVAEFGHVGGRLLWWYSHFVLAGGHVIAGEENDDGTMSDCFAIVAIKNKEYYADISCEVAEVLLGLDDDDPILDGDRLLDYLRDNGAAIEVRRNTELMKDFFVHVANESDGGSEWFR
jgi:hypothetical protein